MLFTQRHFGSVALGTGGLILLAAIGAAIAEAPSGPPAAIGDHVPGRVPPRSVALNPTAGGGNDPGLHLRVPGRTTTARGVRAPRAKLLGDAAGAVTLLVPPGTPGGSPADGGTISVPPSTSPGNNDGGGADSGQQENGPVGTPESGTAIGAHVSLLGLVVGANATLR